MAWGSKVIFPIFLTRTDTAGKIRPAVSQSFSVMRLRCELPSSATEEWLGYITTVCESHLEGVCRRCDERFEAYAVAPHLPRRRESICSKAAAPTRRERDRGRCSVLPVRKISCWLHHRLRSRMQSWLCRRKNTAGSSAGSPAGRPKGGVEKTLHLRRRRSGIVSSIPASLRTG